MIKKEILDIMICPKCRGEIFLDQAKQGIICRQCKLMYEIRDGIPIMLADQAKPLED